MSDVRMPPNPFLFLFGHEFLVWIRRFCFFSLVWTSWRRALEWLSSLSWIIFPVTYTPFKLLVDQSHLSHHFPFSIVTSVCINMLQRMICRVYITSAFSMMTTS
jgi:hypothetical protein